MYYVVSFTCYWFGDNVGMDAFIPVSASIGGILIGLSALVFFWAFGRVVGISGMVAGALTGDAMLLRLVFLGGLLAGAAGIYVFLGRPTAIVAQVEMPWIIIAGLLVGFGARLGGGCTSGHGVCGLSRLSLRSLVATVVFFGVAVLTVYVTRHVIQL